MKKLHFSTLVACIFLLAATSGIMDAKVKEFTYELTCSAQPVQRYNDLPRGVIITSSCEVNNSQIYDFSNLSEKEAKKVAKKFRFIFKPDVADFFDESFRKYVRSTGIPIGRDRNYDYRLRVTLREFKITDGIGSAPCSSVIEWVLISPDNQIVLDGVARGRHTLTQGQSVPDALDNAYSKALADIDWGGIAWILGKSNETEKESNKRADQEKNKQVMGDGDTALEHTVIRWFVVSTPAGADVSWRVVSSTPDIRNTNSNFVGTTPYETTESFDIRGLKYENAGNVQIEITCEKQGYLTQRKRFNLRQAIEQREISAKFNLVKDEEEE